MCGSSGGGGGAQGFRTPPWSPEKSQSYQANIQCLTIIAPLIQKKQDQKSDGRVGPRQAKNSGSIQDAHLFFFNVLNFRMARRQPTDLFEVLCILQPSNYEVLENEVRYRCNAYCHQKPFSEKLVSLNGRLTCCVLINTFNIILSKCQECHRLLVYDGIAS